MGAINMYTYTLYTLLTTDLFVSTGAHHSVLIHVLSSL